MPALLVVAFLVVPLAELYVIVQVGHVLGLALTLAILLLVSVLGAVVVRRESGRAWGAVRVALAAGRMPGREVADGALVLLGGALLLTPGFITDAAGLLLLVRPTRALARRLLTRAAVRRTLARANARRRPSRVVEGRVVEGRVVPATGAQRPRPRSSGG